MADQDPADVEGDTSRTQKKQVTKVRELPDVDIYEKPNFGDENVDVNITALQTTLKEKLKGKDVEQKYIAYNDLGTAYFRLFKFDKAELCHHQHLQLSKPVTTAIPFQDKRPANKKEERTALINLGCVYHAKREFELALQTFKTSLDLAIEQDDSASEARIYNNMSNIYEKNMDFDSAIECQKNRMEKLHKCGDVNGQIKCAASLGSLFILVGEIRESIMYFEKAVINLRMKIVKEQLDALEEMEGGGGEDVIENPEYYDKGVT